MTPFLIAAVVVVAAAAALGAWLFVKYLRVTHVALAPGVDALLGAGGNSLVVRGGDDLLVVDTKFGLGAWMLARWIDRHVGRRVTTVLNTHYHYDHTQGNARFRGARVLAFKSVRGFMLAQRNDFNDPEWWRRHEWALPGEPVPDRASFRVGERIVVALHPGVAHTHGDLVVHLPAEDIVVTGDLCFHTYYPFFNGSAAGCSIPDMVGALRVLAAEHPDATFLPGHGPVARAADLLNHAGYLEALWAAVIRAVAEGRSEREAVRTIDLSGWRLTVLPSFLDGRLALATARNNVRWAYRLAAAAPTRPGGGPRAPGRRPPR